MRRLGIDHLAVLSALALHLMLLTASFGPRPLPQERTQRISVRLASAAPPATSPLPQVVKPHPIMEKNIQTQKPAASRPAPNPEPVVAQPAPAPEPLPSSSAEPVAATSPAAATRKLPTASAPTVTAEPAAEQPQPTAPPLAAARLSEYLALVREAVEANKDYPAFARQLGQQGTVLVAIRIDRDGHLLGAEILSSSGHASLDKAALAAVRKAGRFRAPQGFGLAELRVEIPIAYKLT